MHMANNTRFHVEITTVHFLLYVISPNINDFLSHGLWVVVVGVDVWLYVGTPVVKLLINSL